MKNYPFKLKTQSSLLWLIGLILFLIFFIPEIIFGQGECSPDVESPLVICESFINISIPPSGTVIIDPGFVDRGSFDNCTDPSELIFQFNPSSVSCADIGTTVSIIMTVIDEAGNSNTCMTQALVEDKSDLLLICNSNIIIALPPSGSVTLDEDILVEFAQSNCDPTYTFDPPIVDCDDVGTTVTVQVTATRGDGETNSCTSTVFPQDNSTPSILCPANIVMALPPDGNFTILPEEILLSASDNCELSFTASPSSLDCSDVGDTVPVTITASDPSGNISTCITNFVVQDPRPESVSIDGPAEVECSASGIPFSAIVNGGTPPFNYEWQILRGESEGWSIVSGQGTSNIIVDAGTGRFRLKLIVTDLCGKKRRSRYRTRCVEPAPSGFEEWEEEPTDLLFSRYSINDSKLNIYPNPSSDFINIEVENEISIASIAVYSLAGNRLIEQKTDFEGSVKIELAINHLVNGLYMMVVQTQNGEKLVKRFIKK